jgi:hypothetical protein
VLRRVKLNIFTLGCIIEYKYAQLRRFTFNRLLVALAVFDLMFVISTVPVHTFQGKPSRIKEQSHGEAEQDIGTVSRGSRAG